MQQKLINDGITEVKVDGKIMKIDVDGECGPITDAGIREYQRKHGLIEDGIVGKDTRNSMRAR